MITLVSSNRLEVLADALTEVFAQPLSSPLAPEAVVVQSPGMARWLNLAIVDRMGIAANIDFVQPNNFFDSLMAGDNPNGKSAGISGLTFAIDQVLSGDLKDQSFIEVSNYLSMRPKAKDRFQLASQIAQVFQRYLLFRSEMMVSWASGVDDQWQAALWRRVLSVINPSSVLPFYADAISDQSFSHEFMAPERVIFFGISSLSPLHMSFIEQLGQDSEIYLFCLNPCKDYWGHMPVRKFDGLLPLRFSHEKDNDGLDDTQPLLASWGKTGRDFFDALAGLSGMNEITPFVSELPRSLLSKLQSDLLTLGGNSDDQPTTFCFQDTDQSILCHACHGPMREVEVLYHQLILLFDRHADLKPSDVVVMTPDIDVYAPLINAVFRHPGRGMPHIPFSVADRSMSSESMDIRAFISMMKLSDSRWQVTEILELLDARAVSASAGLTAHDIMKIKSWVGRLKICWGKDAEHKAEFDQPASANFTWAAGLERLMSGLAVHPGFDDMLGEILPFSDLGAEDWQVMDLFISFMSRINAFASGMCKSRSLEEWSAFLSAHIHDLFADSGDSGDIKQQLLNGAAGLIDISDSLLDPQQIHGEVITEYLETRFSRTGMGYGFLTGGVTCCAMLPMRSIPFEVIYLLGMNNDAFPRDGRSPGFDLMAKDPRKGDRSRRQDDRYLFLEVVLSCRRELHISYIGSHPKDNTELPPSVVVSELLDYMDATCTTGDGTAVSEKCIIRHRLQPFSPFYYMADTDTRIKGIHPGYWQIAKALIQPKEPRLVFSDTVLPDLSDHKTPVDIETLMAFLKDPVRFFLTRRLGMRLDRFTDEVCDEDPLELDPLDRYTLNQHCIQAAISGQHREVTVAKAEARGLVPSGPTGLNSLAEAIFNADVFFSEINPLLSQKLNVPPEPLSFLCENRLVQHVMDSRYSFGLMFWRYGASWNIDLLRAWLVHLTIQIAFPDQESPTLIAGLHPKTKDFQLMKFTSVKNPKGLLLSVIRWMETGLQRPVLFDLNIATDWLKAMEKKNTAENADLKMEEAILKKMESDPAGAWPLVFNHQPPDFHDMKAMVTEVLVPMTEHLRPANAETFRETV